jgi:C1A family cysteine protease
MKLLFALLLVSALCLETLTEDHYKFFFDQFKEQYNKKYKADEEAFRYANFKRSLDIIRAHNAKPNQPFSMGLNHLCDMSKEEYAQFVKPLPGQEHMSHAHVQVTHEVTLDGSSWDPTVDWVQAGAVTPIKNQEDCGSCWAFSTTGALEGCTKVDDSVLQSMSEQELVDCDGTCYGCDGCWPYVAMEWVIQNGGLCLESAYPYKGYDSNCEKSQCSSKSTFGSYHQIASGSESGLQSGVHIVPVSIAVDANCQAFMYYDGGLLTTSCGQQLDHAILAVGYGTYGGQPAWRVKNSWGTSWGDAGYIYMLKGSNICGISDAAVYGTGCHTV